MLRSICGPSRSRRHIWCWRPPSSWWGLGGGGGLDGPCAMHAGCTCVCVGTQGLAHGGCLGPPWPWGTLGAWMPGTTLSPGPPRHAWGGRAGLGALCSCVLPCPPQDGSAPPSVAAAQHGGGPQLCPPSPPPTAGGPRRVGGGGGILRPSPSPPPPVLGSPHGRGSPGPGTPRAPGDLWGASKPGSFVPPPSVLQAVAVPAPPAAKG